MTINDLAQRYRNQIREQITGLTRKVKIVGYLAANNPPSKTYARYTANACEDVGIDFELREIEPEKLIETVRLANQDPNIDGIMIYYPIFGDERDNGLKDVISPKKDIEGLSSYWTEKMYLNVRIVDGRKSILPCTPLAIAKVVESSEFYRGSQLKPLEGVTATIFNRSEVVGKPLAAMLANDGATVYSFDISGPMKFTGSDIEETKVTRKEALFNSNIVITGVPSNQFEKVRSDEIRPDALCINFSTVKNFESDVEDRGTLFFRKVGPLTVTMCMRNTLRLVNGQ